MNIPEKLVKIDAVIQKLMEWAFIGGLCIMWGMALHGIILSEDKELVNGCKIIFLGITIVFIMMGYCKIIDITKENLRKKTK